jgi:single-stranded-DNA-specific exonuclease
MKRWTIQKHDREAVKLLADALKVSPLVAALLISRGYETEEKAHKFLNPTYSDLHEPLLLKDMQKAVNRVLKAIENGEKILIWGDYDVDGTTGTAVLRKALKALGAETGYHVPHRFTEGYGLNIEKLKEAKENGFTLAISVDTGSRAFEAADWAKENGLDLIITDHHLSDEKKGNPDAFAVVNPNQTGCEYPDKNLAGVGVAFKLAHALLREKGREDMVEDFLKMVAIGTIADIMQLTGENRAIVALGLKDLPKTTNYGLKALMEVADCTNEMTSYDIGFRIAPRINAAGRMDEALTVIKLFEAGTFSEARRYAEILNNRNRERQKVQQEISELAFLEYVERGGSAKQAHVAVIAGENWHRGVIGLASSRITEKLYRPSLVISLEDGIGHGSARSIENFNLHNALEHCSELFEKFGGHAAACGFTIKLENIEALREKLNAYAAGLFSEDDLIPTLRIDAVVSTETLNLEIVRELKRLEPFGAGNPKPKFLTKDLFLLDEPFVMKEKHLKLKLTDGKGRKFEAVWWDGVEKSKGRTLVPKNRIELAYTPETNTWQGNTRLQLVVEDLRTDN